MAQVNTEVRGALAQLVERLVRNEKVSGSNPLCSTSSVFLNYLHEIHAVVGAGNRTRTCTPCDTRS